MVEQAVMSWLSPLADTVGLIGVVFALLSWLKSRQIQQELRHEQQRQSRQVTVLLQHGGDTIRLPVAIRRAELTRAEILGHMAMVQKEPDLRFKVGYTSKPEFFQQIATIASGQHDATLTIPCTEKEFEQFIRF